MGSHPASLPYEGRRHEVAKVPVRRGLVLGLAAVDLRLQEERNTQRGRVGWVTEVEKPHRVIHL